MSSDDYVPAPPSQLTASELFSSIQRSLWEEAERSRQERILQSKALVTLQTQSPTPTQSHMLSRFHSGPVVPVKDLPVPHGMNYPSGTIMLKRDWDPDE